MKTCIIVGISGSSACGKGTAASYIEEEYSAKRLIFSNILSDILLRLGLPRIRENYQALGKSLRENLGKDVIVNAMQSDIEKTNAKLLLLDGLRYSNEADLLESYPKHYLIYIDAPSELRHTRAQKRGQKGEDIMSLEDFKKRELAATEKGLVELKSRADFVIENTGSGAQLKEKIKEVMDSVIHE